MNYQIATRWRVLVCVATAMVLVGCAKDDVTPVEVESQAFDDLRAELREIVDDPDRESEAIRLIDAVQQDLATLRATVEERRERVRQLNADYDTTRAEFAAYLASVEAEVRDNRRKVAESRQAFFAAVMPEEMEEVAKITTRAMAAAIISIQKI